MNRQVFPSSIFPLRGDISAEAGATSVIVQGLQGIPIIAPPVEPIGLDTLFYDSYNNDWFYASPWDIPVGIPLVWEGYGYGSSGISWIAPDTLAFGNGTDGDVSGAAAMTALVLFGSQSYYGPYSDYDVDYGPSYDQFYTSIFSGATQNWNLILPPNPGTSGQVLTTNGTGVTYWSTVASSGGSVTSFSSGNLSPLFTTSVATPTTTPALSFALNTQNANLVFAGPVSGGAATPTFRALVAADLPAVPWSSLTNPTSNLSLTMGADTTTFNYATGLAAAWIWRNNTPTVTGASTTVALSTSTAPTNVGSVWTYTLAATETGAGSNAWVGASVTTSGWTSGATGNNGTFTITASTTTTVSWTNASGTATNTGTPVMISSAVSSSPVLQIAGTVNTGTAGTLNSVADVWSIQDVIASVTPNPTSTLTFTHSGSGGSAVVSVPFLVVGAVVGANPCSISSANGGLGFGINITAAGITEIIQNGAIITELNSGTTAIAVGAGACINWQNTTNPGNTTNTDLLLSRVSPSVLGLGNVSTLGNFGGSLVSTGLNSDGGILLQQFTTAVGTPTVTPATSGSTSYSYEVVALDINLHPIGVSAAGTTAAAASTITTTNSITVAWAAVAGAFAYAVYRSASGGTPSTTGLLSSSQTITAITTGTSTMVMTVASVALNTLIVGQLLTVSGSSHSNNNGYFYCTAATATSITVFNPYAVAEASPPASAAFIGGVVPASTLSFKDSGFAANSVAAPSTNTSGSLGFVASYESAASGTALSQDFWSIYPVVASGLNGASTLTFAHSGSTGLASISAPNINAVTAFYANGTAGVSAGPFSAITSIQTVGGIVTVLADVSDERLKSFSEYEGGLAEVLAITPIKYTWNTEGQQITGFSEDRTFVGFRAQDVQKAIPEAVTQSASNAEYLGLDDRPVIAALVNAIKELEARLRKAGL